MKLVRFGKQGEERPGILDADGAIRDLSGVVSDITGPAFEAGLFETLSGVDLASLPRVEGQPRLGPCVGGVKNFIAIGLNYVDHAVETNAPIPEEPIIFNKAASCIVGPNDDVVLPKGSEHTDWEVELAFLIGKRTYEVSESEALDHVAGYFICNDVSERRFQLEMGGQWVKGKCSPTFGPIGPYLVTRDEVPDPQSLTLWLDVNGERLQNSTTANMIFPVAHLVSYLSRFMVLEAGDIVTTGTPPGVGLGMKPERYLRKGDVMELSVSGLGVQRQRVV
ncbi:fumarylacetoacetate hydrolase family protein [Telmatospirillum sp. J64-1]|uniref:fumarylacetoacetate hydrolase family protein n=1 Tax=Telmatospirillum sp. J64-1 TaxID=2502183 RepID=UPI00115D182D|nr:fumarylacetoacetate hydrolase family protein [Telmatospirillum sp. J64-1]